MAVARGLYQRSIAVFTALYGADNPRTLNQRRSLAIVLATHGDPASALVEFRQVLDGQRRAYGPDHPRVGESLFDVAECEVDAGGGARDAEALMRQGLAIYRRDLPPDSLQLADGLATLGDFLCQRSGGGEGAALLDQALAILRPAVSADSPRRKSVEDAAARCSKKSSAVPSPTSHADIANGDDGATIGAA